MINFIAVGIGGLIGSVLRYSVTLIPISTGLFPLKTFVVNFIGSFVIGCVGQYMAIQPEMPRHWILFVQVGVCGGFTTFSTFSLEAYDMLNQNQYGMVAIYMAASVALCIFAVFLGMYVTSTAFSK